MAIGDLIEYRAPIGPGNGTSTRTGIDIGRGRIATSTTSGGRSTTTEQARPAGTRTIAAAGSTRARRAAENLWANPGAVLGRLRDRRATSPRASRTSGS